MASSYSFDRRAYQMVVKESKMTMVAKSGLAKACELRAVMTGGAPMRPRLSEDPPNLERRGEKSPGAVRAVRNSSRRSGGGSSRKRSSFATFGPRRRARLVGQGVAT